jgi:hypothetical protein
MEQIEPDNSSLSFESLLDFDDRIEEGDLFDLITIRPQDDRFNFIFDVD